MNLDLKTKIGKPVSRLLNRAFAVTGIPKGIKLLTKAAIIRDRVFLAAIISSSVILLPSSLFVLFLLRQVDFTQRWMYPTKYILQAAFISAICADAFFKRYASIKLLTARWRKRCASFGKR